MNFSNKCVCHVWESENLVFWLSKNLFTCSRCFAFHAPFTWTPRTTCAKDHRLLSNYPQTNEDRKSDCMEAKTQLYLVCYVAVRPCAGIRQWSPTTMKSDRSLQLSKRQNMQWDSLHAGVPATRNERRAVRKKKTLRIFDSWRSSTHLVPAWWPGLFRSCGGRSPDTRLPHLTQFGRMEVHGWTGRKATREILRRKRYERSVSLACKRIFPTWLICDKPNVPRYPYCTTKMQGRFCFI